MVPPPSRHEDLAGRASLTWDETESLCRDKLRADQGPEQQQQAVEVCPPHATPWLWQTVKPGAQGIIAVREAAGGRNARSRTLDWEAVRKTEACDVYCLLREDALHRVPEVRVAQVPAQLRSGVQLRFRSPASRHTHALDIETEYR